MRDSRHDAHDSLPDWREKARRALADSKLSPNEREEISRELAGYLEDLCADAAAGGLNDFAAQIDATQTAAAELHEDQHLGAHLYRARKEDPMYLNDRTKRVWLPGISMFFVSAVLLAVFQLADLWIYRAYAPTPHGNNLPGLMSWMMRHNSAAMAVYIAWLCALPFVAVLGANWSRRAGSGRLAQVATALFPFVLFVAAFMGQRNVGQQGTSLPFLEMGALPPAHIFFRFARESTSLLLSWVVFPGLALLAGVLPFLLANCGSRQQVSAAEPVAQVLVTKRM